MIINILSNFVGSKAQRILISWNAFKITFTCAEFWSICSFILSIDFAEIQAVVSTRKNYDFITDNNYAMKTINILCYAYDNVIFKIWKHFSLKWKAKEKNKRNKWAVSQYFGYCLMKDFLRFSLLWYFGDIQEK